MGGKNHKQNNFIEYSATIYSVDLSPKVLSEISSLYRNSLDSEEGKRV